MKITIIYDNTAKDKSLIAEWGFSCLIEREGLNILFDTGGEADILLSNMKKLNIDEEDFDIVFISHAHWDHAGGLQEIMKFPGKKFYLPVSKELPEHKKAPFYDDLLSSSNVELAGEASEIFPGAYTTGELNDTEQSLLLETARGLVVVAGCSHPGVETILNAAAQFGSVYALIGGLHDFDDYDVLQELDLLCPTHCTQHIEEIKKHYPKKYTTGGAGKVIKI